MRTYQFICPFCGQSANRYEAYFNEGQPFCSDFCRLAEFRSRRMIYIDLPEVQPNALPPDQRQSGDGDGSPRGQLDDLIAWVTPGHQQQ